MSGTETVFADARREAAMAPHAPESFPLVRGYCPKGCGQTLFLGSGGHVTCSWMACPDPCAADDLLWRGE